MILTRTSLRKIALTLMMSVAVLGFASPVSAQVTLYKTDFENPPFTPGDLVGQGGWVHHSGSGSFIQVIVGQAVELVSGSGSREDASVSLGERGLVAGDILYFLFNITVNGTDDATTHYFVHFKDGGTGFNSRIFVAPPNNTGKNFTFAIGETSSSTPAASFAADFNYGVRYTLSGSYTFDTGISTLQVNGSGTIINSKTQADPGEDLQFFAFRQSGGNTSVVIDNVLIEGNTALDDIPIFSDGFEDGNIR